MGVDGALRVAGCAGGVAHGRRLALFQLGPVELLRLGRQQGLVVEQLAELVLGQRLPVRDVDDVLDRRELPGQLVQDRDQRLVDEDQLVVGVLDYEFEVFWEEAQVEGVEHRAHAGDRVVELQVPVVVPAEGGDAVAVLDPQSLERAGQAVDPGHHLAIGGAVNTRLLLGDDLLAREQPLDAPESVLNRQLVVLHQTFHSDTSGRNPLNFGFRWEYIENATPTL